MLVGNQTGFRSGKDKTMKRLKPSTMKVYSARQLAKHIARLNPEGYRVDFAYDRILQEDEGDGTLWFYCSIIEHNKDELIDLIESIYRRQGSK